jgi:nicotinamide-nucleotide amidase
MKAEIIAVGSELLTPDRLDTNSLYITGRLNRMGISVERKTVVGDEHKLLSDAFRESLAHADLVIATGGLGPTEDDLTREAISETLGRRLIRNQDVIRAIESRFRRLGRPMAERNARQAMVPEGASVLENAHGTAPGLWIEADGRIVILLPGPPHELKGIFTEQVEPRLARLAGGVRLFARELRTVGVPESDLDERISPIYKGYSDVQTTILAGLGEIQIHLRTWSKDARAAEQMLDELVGRIAEKLGDSIFTLAGQSMEEIVAAALTQNHATVAAAESCTGGLLAERLTRIPGSSSYFLGGVVCYSNKLKTAWADVPAALIEARGAVSPEVAQALAAGIRLRTGATMGIGITGVAGPGGGTPEKPVGLVYIALSDGAGFKEHVGRFVGDRESVRWFASQMALDMVRRYFLRASQPRPSRPSGVQG